MWLEVLTVLLIAIISWWYLFRNQRPRQFPKGPSVTPFGKWGALDLGSESLMKTFKDLTNQYGRIFSLLINKKWFVVVGGGFDNISQITNNDSIQEQQEESVHWKCKSEEIPELHSVCRQVCRTCALDEETINFVVSKDLQNIIKELNITFAFRTLDISMLTNLFVQRVLDSWCFGVNPLQLLLPMDTLYSDITSFYHNNPLTKTSTNTADRRGIATKINLLLEEKISKADDKHSLVKTYQKYLKLYKDNKRKPLDNGDQSDCVKYMVVELYRQGLFLSTTLKWAIVYLVNNQGAMFDVQEELDYYYGPENLHVKLEDRTSLPITEGALREVQRLASVKPYSNQYCISKEESVEINDYELPSNTRIITDYHSINRDPDVFLAPDIFQSRRFLTPLNELVTPRKWMPLGPNYSSCPYEKQSNCLLFVMFATMIRHLNFKTPVGLRYLDTEGVLQDYVNTPKMRRVRVHKRNVGDIIIQKM